MTAITQDQVDQWRQAIGRRQVATQTLSADALRRFTLAIGEDPDDIAAPPPVLGHWGFFLPETQDGNLGSDGHPARGAFLPPITLPRRMFAASDFRFPAPLAIGEVAECHISIADVRWKNGRSGDLVFVEVDRNIVQAGIVRVAERQTYVYRDAGRAVPLPEPADSTIPGVPWQPSEVGLFRFSAVTFNSHRIHYDWPYATGVEKYPALVVHGPFTAARLAQLAAQRSALAGFTFRALAPLFVGQPIRLQADDREFRAIRVDGTTAMTATATYR